VLSRLLADRPDLTVEEIRDVLRARGICAGHSSIRRVFKTSKHCVPIDTKLVVHVEYSLVAFMFDESKYTAEERHSWKPLSELLRFFLAGQLRRVIGQL